ncbi:hypothetical protein SLS58_011225 [Diplodia intermedia]|uniref:Uncharacterized protein n=1 Tax=Diplodia intermedia TaxID=856260 RepID=A0ABR3T1C9_9PEZI
MTESTFTFASPIERAGFVYHGQLFADAGNLNRHPRASKAELNELLHPEKSAKKPKDQVGHWYVAQLKHYGLPHTKDKNAAKIRLLDALNTNKLKVPADVKKLETALKREYDAANRKAKADKRVMATEPDTPVKKRKDTAATPAKRRKDKSPAPDMMAATPAKKRKGKSPALDTPTATPPNKRKRNAEEDAVPAAQPSAVKKTKQAEPAKKEPTRRKDPAKRKEPAKKEFATQKTPTTPRSSDRTASQRKSAASSTPKQPALGDMKGLYYLTAPVVADKWPTLAAAPKSLKMLLCPDGEKLWGSYTLGPFNGVFLVDEGPCDGSFSFVWRGTDTSDSEKLKFATGLGDMRFLNAKQIEGAFYNLHDYRTTFEGKVQAGARQCPRDALSFDIEWDDYAQANGWFGRPGIRIPEGERPPSGNFAKSSTLSALNANEPRYLPVDSPEGTPPKEEQSIKDEPDVQEPDAQPLSVNANARRTSYITSTDAFYNNSPSAAPSRYASADVGQITGVYDIQCPAIEDDFIESQNNLKLLLCRETRSSKIWGCFAWGPYYGVIQMNPGPSDYSPASVTLGWRARDKDGGSVRFGRGCHGEMEFPEPGSIQGRLFGLHGGVMEFWGKRRPGPKNCGHPLSEFQQEWSSYPSEVYGQREASESFGDALYDRNGNLNPRGHYARLLERNHKG